MPNRPTRTTRKSTRGTVRRATGKRAAAKRVTARQVTALDDSLVNRIGARTIIYVHGIGNKPLPSILKCQWDRALFGFDLGERSRLAYWVNRDYYPEPLDETCESGDLVKIEDEPTGRSISVKQHLRTTSLEQEVAAVATDESDTDALLRMAQEIEASVPAVSEAEIDARAVRGKVLPLPPILRMWITRKLTRAFLRDVNDFFYVEERRRRMRESLLERLRVGGGPFVIVGHSQGSMIAYDVLSRLTEAERRALSIDVRLLVTIGSPLGMSEVQDQLKRLTGQKRLSVPAGVPRWLNVADPLDPVAIAKRLAGDFLPKGRIEDDSEWNEDSPRHPHSGSGYLRTRPVRAAVREAVDTGLFQPVAGFVIARDVVRELENCSSRVRHKVLIELADAAQTAGLTLDVMRERVVERLEREVPEADRPLLRIERLQRYVAADLTREETERLGVDLALKALSVKRIWRNATKHALLDVSTHTVQAVAAHTGYRAMGHGIEWAVLDSGITAAHPHFAGGTIAAQFDCTKPGPPRDGEPAVDEHGHGTHVAGIIAGGKRFEAADGAPARMLSGVATETRLHVYKVLDAEGSGEDAWIIKALDQIATTNERAGRMVIAGVNLSLGGPFDQSVFGCGHSPLCSELRRLWRQGVVVVLAAGNEGFAVLQTLDGTVDANMDLSIGDPANLEEAIAVGSVHKEKPHTYGVSYFSSRGPTADGRQKPDLVAPGEKIVSCRHRFPASATSATQLYVEMSGTSMAAPHVSGVLAAFLSMRREFIGYPDRVKQILLDNCTDLHRDRPQQGAGMPNLIKMLVNT